MAASRNVRTLIQRAAKIATIIGAADPLDANDADDLLLSLNLMLDAWQADRLFAYAVIEQQLAITLGQTSATIGPGGNINVAVRPPKLEYAFTRDAQNFDRQMDLLTQDQFVAITLKSIGNTFPSAAYYVPEYPLGRLTWWQAATSGLTLRVGLWNLITEFPDLNAAVSVPPGYEDAIVYSLAERACTEFEKPVSASLAKLASMARARIKSNNLPTPTVPCEFTGVGFRDGMMPASYFAGGLY